MFFFSDFANETVTISQHDFQPNTIKRCSTKRSDSLTHALTDFKDRNEAKAKTLKQRKLGENKEFEKEKTWKKQRLWKREKRGKSKDMKERKYWNLKEGAVFPRLFETQESVRVFSTE